MITTTNFKMLLEHLNFKKNKNDIYVKKLDRETSLKVDFKNKQLIYPENTSKDKAKSNGMVVHQRQICGFSANENFVVFECIHRLLEKGYKAKHIELEPKWKFGHENKSARADILIRDNDGKPLIIIECKTFGKEFDRAWQRTLEDGGQLCSYIWQEREANYGVLYASDFLDDKIKYENKIITFIDHADYLADSKKDKKIRVYEKAKGTESIYSTWKETYKCDYQTRGFLEPNIAAYKIAQNKYTLSDLRNLDYREIQKKYHEFATILRKYNVSGRENAFDKLVNLFLCKLVDESKSEFNQNDELKFYWKGSTIDTAFNLQDRLQSLYQEGMKRFLKEDVTYINAEKVDKAFRFVKNDPDATRETIHHYFKQLKFFTNNDFAFIDVHNEKLFHQNFKVLLEIVRLFQDISLKTNDDNQFLGDLFEGFLDQGVKQSEGQFFTPMPIVRFIISSLPLKDIVTVDDEEDKPKVIDYACGSGHFLNEYAKQIKVLLQDQDKLKDYYANIYGIEKEYRLSKVAKVSTFMYGQDDVNILYRDGLSKTTELKENSFSVLVANPPYSVKGFLETLEDKDKSDYELIDNIDRKSYSSNNNIQSFFIERTKQLLKSDGVAGIILPSSILSNSDALHVGARELIIKYFDIIAIVEFGSGTFGKTGTNTVTLFLRRRKQEPNAADHYKNRVDLWFSGTEDNKNTVFDDDNYISLYCKQLGYDVTAYKAFLSGDITAISSHELFKDYRKAFDDSTEIKNLKKSRQFKAKSKDEQIAEIESRFLKYAHAIENDKLYYFILVSLPEQPQVIIVKSPSKKDEMKQFLGYEWSASKGNEGIKYLSSSNEVIILDKEETENLDDIEQRALENIQNINHIETPLYNPNDLFDEKKINSLIRANFENKPVVIPDELKDFVVKSRLADMLDFDKVDLKKAINTSPSKKVEIESKWELVRLGDVCDVKKGQSITKKDTIDGGIKVVAGGIDFAYFHNTPNRGQDTITISASGANAGYVNFWREEIFASDCTTVSGFENSDTHSYYIFLFLKSIQKDIFSMARGAAQPHVYPNDIQNIKIPLPPLKTQQEIVAECEAVDKEVEESNIVIKESQVKIYESVTNLKSNNYPTSKLSSLISFNPSKSEIKNIDDKTIVSFIEMSSVSENGTILRTEEKTLGSLRSGSYKYFRDNDIIIAKITPCMENGKSALARSLRSGIGLGSSEFHVFRVGKEVISSYLFKWLNRPDIREDAAKKMTGSSGHKRVPIDYYKSLHIALPPLNKQKKLSLSASNKRKK